MSPEVLDSISNAYISKTSVFGAHIIPYAQYLLLFLAFVQVGWSFLLFCFNTNASGTQQLADIAKTILIVSLLSFLIQNYETYIFWIYKFFVDMGNDLIGTTKISPTSIFNEGMHVTSTLWKTANKQGFLPSVFSGRSWIATIAGMFIFFIYTRIAIEYILTLISSKLVLTVGIIMLAMGINRYTLDFAKKYLVANVAIGIQMLFLIILISIGQTESGKWAGMLDPAVPKDQILENILQVCGGALVFYYLCLHLPSRAAQMLTGSVTFAFGVRDATVGSLVAGTYAGVQTFGRASRKFSQGFSQGTGNTQDGKVDIFNPANISGVLVGAGAHAAANIATGMVRGAMNMAQNYNAANGASSETGGANNSTPNEPVDSVVKGAKSSMDKNK